jgi:hypothetical protein
MRIVLKNTAEVIHYWANQVQSMGECGNVRFRDSMIFSYGSHFCMARHMPDGSVAITTRTYSITTSSHVSAVCSAVNHKRRIYVRDPSASARENLDWAREKISRLLEQAQKPRLRQATRDGLRAEALRVAENANEFYRILKEYEPDRTYGEPIDTSNLDSIREQIEAHERKMEEEKKERQRKAAEEAQEALAEWRRHEGGYRTLYAIQPALRLSMDRTNVETSWGADIPVQHALRLWPLIKSQKLHGRDSDDLSIRVGVYTLTKIKGDGSIIVGCHDIAYGEIYRIAQELNLLTPADMWPLPKESA